MTTIDLPATHRHSSRHGLGHGLAHFATGTLATLREWRRRIHDRAQLTTLSDEMLRDIGISRADATYLGGKPFWRA